MFFLTKEQVKSTNTVKHLGGDIITIIRFLICTSLGGRCICVLLQSNCSTVTATVLQLLYGTVTATFSLRHSDCYIFSTAQWLLHFLYGTVTATFSLLHSDCYISLRHSDCYCYCAAQWRPHFLYGTALLQLLCGTMTATVAVRQQLLQLLYDSDCYSHCACGTVTATVALWYNDGYSCSTVH